MKMFKVEDIKADYLLEVIRLHGEELIRVCYDRDNDLVVSSDSAWFPLYLLNDELCYIDTKVIKIYGRSFAMNSWKLSTEGRPLLWERKEPKKMTLEEVCQKLGYEVEIIK